MNPSTTFITTEQLALSLGLPLSFVQKQADDFDIPWLKVDDVRFFHQKTVETVLIEQMLGKRMTREQTNRQMKIDKEYTKSLLDAFAASKPTNA